MKLTDHMRTALQDAAKHAIRRVHDNHGQPHWPHHSNTLRALLRHGYVEYVELVSRHGRRVQQWSITELGRQALKGPRWTAEEKPNFLAPVSGTTSNHSRAVDRDPQMGALENMEAEVNLKWKRASCERLAELEDPRDRARRLARSARRAA